MTTLDRVLAEIGFQARPQQTALYRALRDVTREGTVAQAGTGTGKSLAVLSAAYDWYEETGKPSLVVVPTNVLMDQYLQLDAPRVAAATGANIKALKGRNRYLCQSADGFSEVIVPPRDVVEQLQEMKGRLTDGEYDQILHEPADTKWWGCPGGEDCDPDLTCHYRIAKELAQAADIIVTNAHLLIIDAQFKRMAEREREEKVAAGEDPGHPPDPIIFPELGVVFVDEAHTLEDNLRAFATRSIPRSAVEGFQLDYVLHDLAKGMKEPTAIAGTAELASALQELAHHEVRKGTPKRLREACESAQHILQRAQGKAYSSNSAVLYIDPAEPYTNQSHRLVTTQIDMALAARGLLIRQPFGLVSATIPRTLREALGIPEALFVDVGHPFDYKRQARLGFSADDGSWKATKGDAGGIVRRAAEIEKMIRDVGGGALLLFPSYRDLNAVHRLIAGPLHLDGYTVLKQDREVDKRTLGERFKADGNAVLFGTESFATGFDVPGEALRLVAIWKLPYPGLDPLIKAISARDFRRYQDMMLMKVAQAAGRLIRTSDDTGTIWIADSRARRAILGSGDPMLAHFDEMQLLEPTGVATDSYHPNVEMN